MPLLGNRIQETTTTGGTGTLTLAGAVTGYRTFNAVFANGSVVFYCIDDGAGNWEIGYGTVGTGTLTRSTVLGSSNADNLVNFTAGTSKRVFNTAPSIALLPDQTSNSGKYLTTDGSTASWTSAGAFTTLSASSTVTLSGGTANGVLYLNGSKVATSGTALVFDGTNLGLGVTPSAWNAGKAIQLGTGTADGALWSSGNDTEILTNAYYASGFKYQSTGYQATKYTQSGGVHYWYNSNNTTGTANATWTPTQAMTLDASGNLGLGATISPFYIDVAPWLQVNKITIGNYGGFDIAAYTNNAYYSSSGVWKYVGTAAATQYVQYAGAHRWSTASSGTAGNSVSWTQAMTLEATGFLGLGLQTSPAYRFDLLTGGSAGIQTVARFGTTGNGGSGRGAGILIGASGSSSSVDVAQIVGYQNAAASTASSAALAFQVANSSAVLTEAARFDNAGNLLVGGTTSPGSGTGAILTESATGGIGYGTGSGGAVTQATSRTTGVTINKPNGAITLFSAAGSTTPATFTVTNSTVAATDVIHVSQKSGSNLYVILVTAVGAGSFNITQYTTGGTTSEAPVFNFAVMKAVAA